MTTFEEFAHARTPHLHRSAWLLCGDRHQAEDLVQETLAKVFVRWGRRGPRIENPAAYAQTTLVRTFLSGKRRRSSTELPFADLPDTTGSDPTSGSDLRMSLLAALAQLSDLDRAVLVLRYLHDLPVDEVANQLGLTSGAVRTRSSRATERVRPLLSLTTVKEPS